MTLPNNLIAGNFSFLKEHDPLFVELAGAAERAFSSDPNTTLIKLRQFSEAMAQHIAVRPNKNPKRKTRAKKAAG